MSDLAIDYLMSKVHIGDCELMRSGYKAFHAKKSAMHSSFV